MNAKILLAFLSLHSDPNASAGSLGYIIGGFVALLILGYLIYTLLHPEKF